GGALGAAAVADGVEAAAERRQLLARLSGGSAPAFARPLARGRGGRRGLGGQRRRGGRRRGGGGRRRLAARLDDLDLAGAAEHHLGSTLEALDAARRAHAPPLVEALRLAGRSLEERQQDDDAKCARIVAGEFQDPGIPDGAGRRDLAFHAHDLADVAARLLPRDDRRRGGACGPGRERDECGERGDALHGRGSSVSARPLVTARRGRLDRAARAHRACLAGRPGGVQALAGRRVAAGSLAIPPAHAAAAAPTAPTASTGRPLASLAHGERPAPERLAVEGADRRLGLGIGGQLDEGEAARPAGLPVGDDLHLLDLAPLLLEEGAQLRLVALVGQVAYVQSLSHSNSRTNEDAE